MSFIAHRRAILRCLNFENWVLDLPLRYAEVKSAPNFLSSEFESDHRYHPWCEDGTVLADCASRRSFGYSQCPRPLRKTEIYCHHPLPSSHGWWSQLRGPRQIRLFLFTNTPNVLCVSKCINPFCRAHLPRVPWNTENGTAAIPESYLFLIGTGLSSVFLLPMMNVLLALQALRAKQTEGKNTLSVPYKLCARRLLPALFRPRVLFTLVTGGGGLKRSGLKGCKL